MNIHCKSTIYKSTIYGETIEDLLPGLLTIKNAMTTDADGMCHASFTLTPKDGAPFLRALMRVEAELLIEDADSIGCRHAQDRTQEQRAADALLLLFQAVGERPPIRTGHRARLVGIDVRIKREEYPRQHFSHEAVH